MLPSHLLTLIIFILTYAVIALGEIPWARIDRTGAALAGAVAMVVSVRSANPQPSTLSISTRLRCCSE